MEIVVVDDHAATREEIVGLIEQEEDMWVVGQAPTGEEGVLLVQALHPDVVLMDVVMPGINGIVATEAIHATVPEARVLVLSNHTGEHLVSELLRAGARGYLRKDCAYEQLVPAIRTIAADKRYIGEHASG